MGASMMLGELATRRDGFTSLEAAVALAISAGVIGVALTAFSAWAGRVAAAEQQLLATKTAEALIARIGLDLRPAAQQLQGERAGFVWEFVVGPAPLPQPPTQGLQAQFSARRHGASAPFLVLQVPVAVATAR